MQDLLSLRLSALADPTRRAILARLARGEATVSELRQPFPLSQPAISKHLKVLETAGLIESGQAAQTRPRRLRREALEETGAWFAQMRAMWSDSLDRLEELLAHPEDRPEKGTT
ncbi:transcriptional regulator, ArsR family [Roseomonas rosea]|uniref:Transcriptional regulator, ArsR family n=2 Tax=Muricoccus roseus TaxID=198092 RepID=A0A1M6Q6E6_9PROT|nr:transcriptional regulator, ArsR family [Roseomonas rosea]